MSGEEASDPEKTGPAGPTTEPTVPDGGAGAGDTGRALGAGDDPGSGDDRGAGAEPATPRKRPGPVRRLYDWMLHWADTPHGTQALVGLTAAESSFFPIPPDPLLMALCLGRPKKSLRFAAWATLASVLGGIFGYLLGTWAWHLAADFFYTWVPGVSPEAFETVRGYYDRWDFWAIFLAGLTPIPFKVFTLSAGVFAVDFWIFVVASALSRGIRFYAEAGLIYRYGPPIQRFIDRYFNLLSIVFGILLVGGFAVIKLLL